jgi:hypothetical protein
MTLITLLKIILIYDFHWLNIFPPHTFNHSPIDGNLVIDISFFYITSDDHPYCELVVPIYTILPKKCIDYLYCTAIAWNVSKRPRCLKA